jgi:hypothetical protein
MIVAQLIVWFLGIYVSAGLLFAPFFITRGAGRIDPSVQQSTWGFRVMIVPGVIALWPLLLLRLLRGIEHPPTETNAHRNGSANC